MTDLVEDALRAEEVAAAAEEREPRGWDELRQARAGNRAEDS